MKYFYSILAISLLLVLHSCKEVKHVEAFSLPQGLFINQTLLDSCHADDVLQRSFLFLDLNFKFDSTVVVNLGDEKFSLPVSTSADGRYIMISRPSSFGEKTLMIISETELLLKGSENEADTKFQVVNREENTPQSFEYLLNECLLAGEYDLSRNGEKQPGIVTIMANGQLNGMKPYLGYELCLGKSCRDEFDFNTIDLIDQSGKRETFEFKAEDKSRLQFSTIPSGIDNNAAGVTYELKAR